MEISQREFEKLLIESVRYCLGRQTYAVSECAAIVYKYWRQIGSGVKNIIRRDIYTQIERHTITLDVKSYQQQLEEGFSYFLGHECDAFTWIELLNWIDEQEKKDE